MPTLDHIREQIQELSLEERVELTEWLLAGTTPDDIDAEIEAESERIAQERLARLEAGLAKTISEEEFWRRAAAHRDAVS
jgi:protein-arginine kinase activator protein McsA